MAGAIFVRGRAVFSAAHPSCTARLRRLSVWRYTVCQNGGDSRPALSTPTSDELHRGGEGGPTHFATGAASGGVAARRARAEKGRARMPPHPPPRRDGGTLLTKLQKPRKGRAASRSSYAFATQRSWNYRRARRAAYGICADCRRCGYSVGPARRPRRSILLTTLPTLQYRLMCRVSRGVRPPESGGVDCAASSGRSEPIVLGGVRMRDARGN